MRKLLMRRTPAVRVRVRRAGEPGQALRSRKPRPGGRRERELYASLARIALDALALASNGQGLEAADTLHRYVLSLQAEPDSPYVSYLASYAATQAAIFQLGEVVSVVAKEVRSYMEQYGTREEDPNITGYLSLMEPLVRSLKFQWKLPLPDAGFDDDGGTPAQTPTDGP